MGHQRRVDVVGPQMMVENQRINIGADFGEFVGLVKGSNCRILARLRKKIMFSDRLAGTGQSEFGLNGRVLPKACSARSTSL